MENPKLITLINSIENKDKPWLDRSRIAGGLGKLGKEKPQLLPSIIDSLIKALKNQDSSAIRNRAAESLGELGQPCNEFTKQDSAIINSLLQAFKDENPDVRSSVANALIKLGEFEQYIVPYLINPLIKKIESLENIIGSHLKRRAIKETNLIGEIKEILIPSIHIKKEKNHEN